MSLNVLLQFILLKIFIKIGNYFLNDIMANIFAQINDLLNNWLQDLLLLQII